MREMSRRRFNEGNWRKDPWFKALCKALASCESEKEVADLLRDVGTLSELKAWSERLEVARRLFSGCPYREVSEKTGASTTTVTRVASFLNDGEGGYMHYMHDHHAHIAPAVKSK